MVVPKSSFKRSFVATLERRLKEEHPLIQVLLGPRQVGKTTGVLMLPRDSLKIRYVSADEALSLGPDWISEQWQVARLEGGPVTLVIDEIQKVLGWSDRIKALWDADRRKRSGFRLVLLGSSSLSLQRGLEESLAGRFELIPVHHWSFDESHRHFGFSLDQYLAYGGYPESARFVGDLARWQAYLKGSIIETVVGRDILRQATVRKPALFRQSFEILSSYPAQEVSYNKLLGQIQEGGNVELVKHYIELFEGAFLFKALQKYSGSAARSRASSPKILPMCPALFSFRSGGRELSDPEIRGRVFEAAVGAELAKSSWDLYYWREKVEVDFVLVRGREILAVEVKSGRRKSARGLEAFTQLYPRARPIFVTPDNFALLSKDPDAFLERAAGG